MENPFFVEKISGHQYGVVVQDQYLERHEAHKLLAELNAVIREWDDPVFADSPDEKLIPLRLVRPILVKYLMLPASSWPTYDSEKAAVDEEARKFLSEGI